MAKSVEEKVKEIIVEQLEVDEEDVNPNAKFIDELKYVDKKDARRLDPYLKYAIATSVMAVEDAALDTAKVDSTRFGVLIGSGIGGISTLLDGQKVLDEKGPDRVSPFIIPMLIVNMAAGLV